MKATLKKSEKLQALADKIQAKAAALKDKKPKLSAALEKKAGKLEEKAKALNAPVGSEISGDYQGPPISSLPGIVPPSGLPGTPAAPPNYNPKAPAMAGGISSYPPDTANMGNYFDKLLGIAAPAAVQGVKQIAGGSNVFDTLGDVGGSILGGLLPGESAGYPTGSSAGTASSAAPLSAAVPMWVWIGGGLLAAFIVWKLVKK